MILSLESKAKNCNFFTQECLIKILNLQIKIVLYFQAADTTALTNSFFILAVAMYPEIQVGFQ